MPRSRPISLSVMPDADLDASDTAQVVLQAYTTAMTFARNEQKAFDTAVWAWRKPSESFSRGWRSSGGIHHLPQHVDDASAHSSGSR
jgi:hypothetical protein